MIRAFAIALGISTVRVVMIVFDIALTPVGFMREWRCPEELSRDQQEQFMGIETRIVDDTVIVELSSSSMPLGSDDQSLADTIRHLLDQGHRKIVVKLEGVPVIDSATIGEIVPAYTAVSQAGGTMRLEGVGEHVRHLFADSGLAKLIEPGRRPRDPFSPHLGNVNWSALVGVGFLILVILVTMLWKMGLRL